MKIYFVAAIVFAFTCIGCKKKVEQINPTLPVVKSSNNVVRDITFAETRYFIARIDSISHKIYLTFGERVDITAMSPDLKLSSGATSNIFKGRTMDFSITQNFDVTAEDGTKVSYSVESIQSKTNIIAIFNYDKNKDRKLDEGVYSSVELSKSEFPLIRKDSKKLMLIIPKLIPSIIVNGPVYLSGKEAHDFGFNCTIDSSILNNPVTGTYKFAFPNTSGYFTYSFQDGGSSFPFSNKGEINIKKIDRKFNTISGTVTNADAYFGMPSNSEHPISVKFTKFEFENLPLLGSMD